VQEVVGVEQVPQSPGQVEQVSVPLQEPSPQVGVGVSSIQTLFMQVYPELQEPQDKVPPHPSDAVPQLYPKSSQVVGVQVSTLLTVRVIISVSVSSPSETIKVVL